MLSHSELGCSVDLPSAWTSLAQPFGVFSSSNIRNEMGRPIGKVYRINCSSPLSTEPDQLLDLYRVIAASFSVE